MTKTDERVLQRTTGDLEIYDAEGNHVATCNDPEIRVPPRGGPYVAGTWWLCVQGRWVRESKLDQWDRGGLKRHKEAALRFLERREA